MRFMVAGATTTVEDLLADPGVSPYLGAMVTPNTANSVRRVSDWGLPWVIDNACFDAKRFSPTRFLNLCERAAAVDNPPVFVTVPDKVADHDETLRLFFEWLPRLTQFNLPLAFVAEDGIDGDFEVSIPWAYAQAVFIGGTDDFKEDVTIDIADHCHRRGKWCHMGRVNGRRRLRLALHNSCDSVDGSSLSRFARTWIPTFAGYAKALECEAARLDHFIQEGLSFA